MRGSCELSMKWIRNSLRRLLKFKENLEISKKISDILKKILEILSKISEIMKRIPENQYEISEILRTSPI